MFYDQTSLNLLFHLLQFPLDKQETHNLHRFSVNHNSTEQSPVFQRAYYQIRINLHLYTYEEILLRFRCS